MKTKGQIVLWPLIGVATTLALAAYGYLMSDISKTQADVQVHKQEDIRAYTDIAALKADVSTIKENQKQQTADIKEILKIIK